MGLEELTSAEAVVAAMDEFDRLGRSAFLAKYGFGEAKQFFVRRDGRLYDSKAIAGAAFGIQHPERGALSASEFSGGETGAVRVLRGLGFEVEDQRATGEPRVWIVRAGQHGENEALALSQDVVVIGWGELPDLSSTVTREGVRAVFEEAYRERGRSADQQIGMIYRFVHEISRGDLVLLPLHTKPSTVAVGVVEGSYRYRSEPEFANDAQHTRAVRWLAREASYASFDRELQRAFGLQGTVRQVHQPGVYGRLTSVVSGPADPDALHLVVKWSAGRRADTVERHIEVANEKGAVWWGLATSGNAESRVSEQWLARLRTQIAAGTPTHVFISGPTCWKTNLLAVVYSREETDEALIPAYYAQAELTQHHLWVKLADFAPVERHTLLRSLDSERANRRGRPIALGNQTNPLLVRARSKPRVWLVAQGASFQRAREGGYLWAPSRQRNGGTPFDYWRNMCLLRKGDLVLNYANTQIRAVSRVAGQATTSPQPETGADQAWAEEGWRAEIEYRDLEQPLSINDVPVEWRTAEGGPFDRVGNVKQGYLFPLTDSFVAKLASRFPQLGIDLSGNDGVGGAEGWVEPSLESIVEAIQGQGLTISPETVRRYHLSLKTRGFVVLSGISGTGKTWLANAYADAVGGEALIVPVAPNWTTNEDLLGYLNPLTQTYHDTEFSHFLRRAANEHRDATQVGRTPRPFFLVLDEMNLARVEYYFAKFLSAVELRARTEQAMIELAPGDEVPLPPNLRFTGTVNVDETTHGFADKVYDRSQLIELTIDRDAVVSHLGQREYTELLTEVWETFQTVAPFAFRVLDEITRYVDEADALAVPWQTALDEQLLQKVLPKVKGTDLRIAPALTRFQELAAERFPRSHAKATVMLQAFHEHGFTSYF
jgi:MoxR-like ATPase